ncbi:pyridoxal-phosphate-dependent aminotransferase family protein [Promicromonospora thailandica]|uniref:(S)-ureidoglycine-glyoxylate aminotransferase n=1 Tax=Promicromonospora thailandica TaxID=765201 RepID=A0A9X2G1X5_9MICO|nr:alanine--glyoxylate aminotransferase family protein [Promicromonospora thailandica]MCP2264158.1 (S)-ureidoglycine-glyoxylate aminotransferase [Promicromonospora thailandica]BFF21174.1 alanine--glyoxylate aminotransferase family protein [Promicromonospora thailandica]
MTQVHPPARLLMGPGPVDADPRVLRAMAAPLVGQFDPFMTGTMTETMALWRTVWDTTNEQTFLVDGTSRAGIEAALVSLLEPGDRVLVPVFGRFGHLLAEIGARAGAEVHTIETEWGTVFDPGQVEDAVRRVRPRVVAVVHGDTSTTMAQPLADLGRIAHEHDALLYVDATATLGGNPFPTDTWGVDAATAGLQKCLGGPSGSAPVTLSPAAVAAIGRRTQIEAGLRTAHDVPPAGAPIRSNYLDLAQIMEYWGPRRLNHHTEATSMLYAARECARLLADEGVDAAVARHARHGAAMLAGVRGLGLEVFGDPAHTMHNVVAVRIPAGVDGDAVRGTLLDDFGIEIGTSFGPLHGVVWRIGTMGYNARRDAVLTTLAALEHVLRRAGHPAPAGGGTDAALASYAEAP